MKHLLLVEDDASLGATLKERLEKERYRVFWARSLQEARASLRNEAVHLVILDVGLPDGSGFDFAREIRQGSDVPFIFVTAQNTAEDRLLGYEIGGAEYIPKPFHLKELLLRVGHVLEDHADAPALPSVLRYPGFEIDFGSFCVRRGGAPDEFLSAKDAELLRLLIEKSPEVVSRDRILDQIWGEEKFPSTRTVDNSIVRLRQAIGDGDGSVIRSVRGVGYQWVLHGE